MSNFESVKHFMTTFGQAVQDFPKSPHTDVIKLRLELTLEEVRELFEATINPESSNMALLSSMFDTISMTLSKLDESDFAVDIVETADALTDIEYINLGTAAAFGINIDATFAEVHSSNMSKLGEDGKPIYREDGKVKKGPNYRSPDLVSVLFPAGQPIYDN